MTRSSTRVRIAADAVGSVARCESRDEAMTVTENATGNATTPLSTPAQSASARPSDRDVHLISGTTIADGRLRLLIFHGGPRDLQFWQGLDLATGQQVALTLIDPDEASPAGTVDAVLDQTARLRGIDMPGLAKVVALARIGRGGLVVSDWTRGGSLRQVANTAPSPIRVADAVQSLAAAAETAHRAGLALSIDHPGRVRVSREGDVVLAFPGTMPHATPGTDLRGIGGV